MMSIIIIYHHHILAYIYFISSYMYNKIILVRYILLYNYNVYSRL